MSTDSDSLHEILPSLDVAGLYDALVETSINLAKASDLVTELTSDRRAIYAALHAKGESYASIGRCVGLTRMAIKHQIDRYLADTG